MLLLQQTILLTFAIFAFIILFIFLFYPTNSLKSTICNFNFAGRLFCFLLIVSLCNIIYLLLENKKIDSLLIKKLQEDYAKSIEVVQLDNSLAESLPLEILLEPTLTPETFPSLFEIGLFIGVICLTLWVINSYLPVFPIPFSGWKTGLTLDETYLKAFKDELRPEWAYTGKSKWLYAQDLHKNEFKFLFDDLNICTEISALLVSGDETTRVFITNVKELDEFYKLLYGLNYTIDPLFWGTYWGTFYF